jgi:hypothetical protein
VTQSIAEGVERLAVKIAIGSLGHGIVAESRKLVDRIVEGDRQAASGAEIRGQRLRYGSFAFFARIPSFEDCWQVFIFPVHGSDGH